MPFVSFAGCTQDGPNVFSARPKIPFSKKAAQLMFSDTLTPTILVDQDRLERNIRRMQEICNAHRVELWPHVKTHKMVEVARMQLEAGARGLVCSKIGEALAMLPSGVKRVFLAHSIVDKANAPRLCALAEALDQLILACTSQPQAEALEGVLAAAGLTLPIMLGVDTGLGREGVRGVEEAERAAAFIARQPHMRLLGLYSHEGHAYGAVGKIPEVSEQVRNVLNEARRRIDRTLLVWPGCSVTAAHIATLADIDGVRPGTYVFGDLSLAAKHKVMAWDDLAATVLATVIDRPEPGLALLDAGSKTLSSDKTYTGISASLLDGRDIHVTRCSEEHGWATGSQVNELRVGERVRLVAAHICPVLNLADEVAVVRGEKIVATWKVAARGKVQ